MKVEVSTSSVPLMVANLKELKAGTLTKEKLHKTLMHKDYQMEFQRYTQKGMPMSTITMEEYEDYLLSCLSLKESQVKNPRLRMVHNELLEFINNIDAFDQSAVNRLDGNSEIIDAVETTLKNGLDEKTFQSLETITIVSTIGIGNSFGYPYKNHIHFDAKRMKKFLPDDETLIALIAHEIHHILMNNLFNEIDFKSSKDYFLVNFSFEGLAVKFNNNALGTLSKAFRPDRKVNLIMDMPSWKFLEEDLDSMFEHLRSDVKRIEEKHLSMDEVADLFKEYWMTPDAESGKTGEKMTLSQYRVYYMGNEIFGTLYDNYGRDELFDIIRHPENIAEKFNAVTEEKYHIN